MIFHSMQRLVQVLYLEDGTTLESNACSLALKNVDWVSILAYMA